jgi:hypothetical protein
MKELIRYEVFDKKDRWMGSYSNQLNHPNLTPLEMAKTNANSSNGKVYAVFMDDSREVVYSTSIR